MLTLHVVVLQGRKDAGLLVGTTTTTTTEQNTMI